MVSWLIDRDVLINFCNYRFLEGHEAIALMTAFIITSQANFLGIAEI